MLYGDHPEAPITNETQEPVFEVKERKEMIIFEQYTEDY